MISTVDAGELAPFDLSVERQQQGFDRMVHAALDEILANTPMYEVSRDLDEYDQEVASLHERVMYAEPHQRLGAIVLRPKIDSGAMANDLVVMPEYDKNDPYDARIKSIEMDIMALHQFSDVPPEDYALLELEKAVIEAERNIQTELGQLTEDTVFVKWFCEKLDEVIPHDAPIDDVDIRRAEAEVLAEYIAEVNPPEERGDVVVQLLKEILAQQDALVSLKETHDDEALAIVTEMIEPILDVVEPVHEVALAA